MERQSATHDIDELQASMLRSLASAHRLHLAAMRSVGLVEAIRDGRTVRYRLADSQILAACELMRAVLVRRLSRLGDLAAAAHEPTLLVLSPTEVRQS
jgi:DNA-binding transcriptional ArsR family regulator